VAGKVLEIQFANQRVVRVTMGAVEDRVTIHVFVTNTSATTQHYHSTVTTDAAVSTHDIPGILAVNTTAAVEVEFIGDVDNLADALALEVSRIAHIGSK
jgi:hypothetical protein